MTNTNCLEGVKCPACGNEDTFRIEVITMATVTDDGTDFDGHGGVDWNETSYAECAGCPKHGKLSDFKAQGEVPPGSPPPTTLLDALQQALAALNTAPRFAVPSLDTDSYKIAARCERAIAKAKGAAQ